MTISLRFLFKILIISIISIISFIIFDNLLISVTISLLSVLLFAHRNKKRPSTKQKHTATRSGEVYDVKQNEKRGDKK